MSGFLGEKKHKKCEKITGKKYRYCSVHHSDHGIAYCLDDNNREDVVNYVTQKWLNPPESFLSNKYNKIVSTIKKYRFNLRWAKYFVKRKILDLH